ncbi:MAG: ribonuclease P protein component [Lachnospiraceae bacterium]|nr:ribonuclease P protein component [Lachnospiraceae bacterium]
MESIKNNRDFLTVYRTGRSYANRYLVMYLAPAQEGEEGRLGISVSKKVGNSVVRHRVKRLIKESFRLNVNRFRNGCDIVVVARKEAKGRNYSEIESAVMHLARLHGVLLTEDSSSE